jgi:hypothetical protein
MCLRCTSLITENEACTDPDGTCTKHQCCSQALAIKDTTSSDDLNFLTREWTLLACDQLLDSRNQDACWDIAAKSQLRKVPNNAVEYPYPV